MSAIEQRIKEQAQALGFAQAGVVRPDPTAHRALYESWIDAERHGEMHYLAREDSRRRRFDLSATMPEVRSVVVVAHAYRGSPEIDAPAERGIVARYARGRDYHDVVVPRLRQLRAWIEEAVGRPVSGRAYADTGPILERDLAWRAGLGWFGKNTMSIHPKRGSFWFIGSLLLDLELEPDPPFDTDHCGSCRACLDGCPTEALLGRDEQGAPVMDARRCISYLTIEHRGPIPFELRASIGNRIFGCDICQDVCPWNERFGDAVSPDPAYAEAAQGEAFHGRALVEIAEELVVLDESDFKRAFRSSPLYRAHREGLLRNVCVALGNYGGDDAVSVLERALADSHPLVRGHAAWALGQIGGADASAALIRAQTSEADPFVIAELRRAT